MPGAAPSSPFEPHNRVAGKFRLRRRLATGGMGEVWVARNESIGADVALKVLRGGDGHRDLEFEERFRHEARLSAMLAHRSIVRVFDLVEEPPATLVLVMELLRGETLRDHLERKGPRSAREAIAIITPILSALSHAHSRGIIHRDVTPSNIFLATDPDGHVSPKLLDFGIAKIAANTTNAGALSLPLSPVQTLDGRVLGTPRYMAPERIRGSSDVDGRADVFSIAVVLYEILTGASPFAASSPSASLAAVLERHVDPDPRIEPRLWLEIQRAMSKRPYERHVSAQEMATALRAALGETEGGLEASLKRTYPPSVWGIDGSDEDVSVVPRRENTRSAITARRARRSPVPWILAVGAIALATGIATFATHHAPRTPPIVADETASVKLSDRPSTTEAPAPPASGSAPGFAVPSPPVSATGAASTTAPATPSVVAATVPALAPQPSSAPPAPSAPTAPTPAPSATASPTLPDGPGSPAATRSGAYRPPKAIATTPGF